MHDRSQEYDNYVALFERVDAANEGRITAGRAHAVLSKSGVCAGEFSRAASHVRSFSSSPTAAGAGAEAHLEVVGPRPVGWVEF
jgi:hypothetical protein